MDRRTPKSLLRDYAVPMQDNSAYSLSYGKDSTKDPRKATKKTMKPSKGTSHGFNNMYRDTTGLLKFKGAAPLKSKGGQLATVAAKKVCPICGKENCPGCQVPMPTKKEAPSNIKSRFDVTKAKDPSVIAQVPKKLLYTTPDGIKVYEVDDDFVKINLYDDFTEGGNWEAYPEFVPKGEIWVANDKTPINQKDIITHELTEVRLMQNKGLTYEEAHKLANKIEMDERIKERPGLLVTKRAKGGKVGNPKHRDKPGGSNVGKYSKSEGPFAGPSGGAPAGSYPIGSKQRGKSALKLAHNAPNPSGIKSTVYRKYPDLKPDKKAMEGAKLSIGGMGRMQDKAPQPTKHNAPPDKVKKNFALYKRKEKTPKRAFAH